MQSATFGALRCSSHGSLSSAHQESTLEKHKHLQHLQHLQERRRQQQQQKRLLRRRRGVRGRRRGGGAERRQENLRRLSFRLVIENAFFFLSFGLKASAA